MAALQSLRRCWPTEERSRTSHAARGQARFAKQAQAQYAPGACRFNLSAFFPFHYSRRRSSCAPQIEERELNYYTANANTVGTQAALLAGFAFTGIIEAPWDHFEEQNVAYPVRAMCVMSTLLGMLFELLAIVKSVQISILGPGLALRGSEGSMTRALSVMRHEQRRLHWEFYMGLFFFHLATGSFCMGLFYDHDKVTAFMCVGTLLLSFTWLCLDCRSVAQQLWLPPAASLWRGEVDRRPANQQKSVRYSCTGAVVGVPGTGQHATAAQQQASNRASAGYSFGAPFGAPAPNGGGGGMYERSLPPAKPAGFNAAGGKEGGGGKRRPSMKPRLPDPFSGSFRLPDGPGPMMTPGPHIQQQIASAPAPAAHSMAARLMGRGSVTSTQHPDESAVRHLISATMVDWTTQQAAQWHRRGSSALAAADWWLPGGGRRHDPDALINATANPTTPLAPRALMGDRLAASAGAPAPAQPNNLQLQPPQSPSCASTGNAAAALQSMIRPSPLTLQQPPQPNFANAPSPQQHAVLTLANRQAQQQAAGPQQPATSGPTIVVQRSATGGNAPGTPPVRRRLSHVLFSGNSGNSRRGGTGTPRVETPDDTPRVAATPVRDALAIESVSAIDRASAAVDAADAGGTSSTTQPVRLPTPGGTTSLPLRPTEGPSSSTDPLHDEHLAEESSLIAAREGPRGLAEASMTEQFSNLVRKVNTGLGLKELP